MRELGGIVHFDKPSMSHPVPWADIPKDRTPEELVKDEEGFLGAYHRQEKKMRAVVSPGNILVYTVEEGWSPLCGFLELGDSCPDEPFPHINQAIDLGFVNSVLIFICYAYPFIMLLLIALILLVLKFVVGLFGSFRSGLLPAQTKHGKKHN